MPTQLHPGQFPIGSLASRAAARRLSEERLSELDLVEMYSRHEGLKKAEFGEWESHRPGSMTRFCKIPAGMTFDEALADSGLPTTRTRGEHIRLKIDL